MEEGTYQRMLKVVDRIEKEERRRRWLVVIAVFFALVIGTIAILTYANYRSDAATQRAIAESKRQMEELCSSGAIDCRGSSGLPGPKGKTGTGIANVTCEAGRFVFTTTAGKRTAIGDCIAEDGARGPRGFTGRAGRDGDDGPRGPRGFTGRPGQDGQNGRAGRDGARGTPGQSTTCQIVRGLLGLPTSVVCR